MSDRWIRPLVMALMVGSCDSRPQAPPQAKEPATSAPVASPPAAPQEARVPAGEAAARVALDGEGLRWIELPSGRTRLLAFGAPAGAVEEALARVWGPWRERMAIPDCGAEPPTRLTWANGIAVLRVDGVFVGWSASRPRPAGKPGSRPEVQSMAGLGVGATRAEVEDAYALEVRETTLGTEFEAGGISGVFDDASPSAEVASLWAGRACIYR